MSEQKSTSSQRGQGGRLNGQGGRTAAELNAARAGRTPREQAVRKPKGAPRGPDSKEAPASEPLLSEDELSDHETVDDALAAAEAELDLVAEALDDIEEFAQPAAPEDVVADVDVGMDMEEEPSEAPPAAPPPPEAPRETLSADDQATVRIDALEARVGELKGELLRTLAETENVRKRGERQITDAKKYAISDFARDLLSVADNLHRALEAIPDDKVEGNDLLRTMRAGVQAVEKDLLAAFEKCGIARIEPLGAPFDPHKHQAMFEIPDSDQPPGTVVQLLQVGYVLHERLLRPAMVGIAKGGVETKVDTTA